VLSRCCRIHCHIFHHAPNAALPMVPSRKETMKQSLVEALRDVNQTCRLRVDDWIAPWRATRCRYCDEVGAAMAICPACARDLPWNEHACPRCAAPQTHDQPCRPCLRRAPQFDSAWAAFRMEPPVQQAIHALKYHASFVDARLLGQLLATRLRGCGRALPDLLLPMPLHRSRLLRRGYNQALEVARVIGRELGLAVPHALAQRTRATADQIGKTAAQRRRNVRGAFAVSGAVAGRHVALIDDVMTTGATLDELARACRAAGAAQVQAWAIARVA
jgi:ComF family protein